MLIARLRKATPVKKLKLMVGLNKMMRTLSLSNIQALHPDASEAELQRYLADRILGREEAKRYYGPLPDEADSHE
jgi:hypothetical protein